MELLDPVGGVAQEELADGARVVAVEVDRLSPLVLVAVGEVVGGERLEVVAIRPEVVVDDVEDDPEAGRVGAVDEAAEVVGRAVQPGRREQVDAVAAPAETAGELGDRHHLDGGDAQVRQRRQLSGGRLPGPLRREGADVQLVEHLPVAADAAPVVVGPREAGRVDHLRGPVRPVGLEARRRVGVERRPAVEAESVARARLRPGGRVCEVAAFLRRQLEGLTAGLKNDFDPPPRRRPGAEVGPARDHLRTDGEPPPHPRRGARRGAAGRGRRGFTFEHLVGHLLSSDCLKGGNLSPPSHMQTSYQFRAGRPLCGHAAGEGKIIRGNSRPLRSGWATRILLDE